MKFIGKDRIRLWPYFALVLAFFTSIVPSLKASTDYGPAIYRPMSGCSKWYTGGNGHHFVVIHDMEGYYWSTISYLNRCDIQVSIHFLVNGKQDTGTDVAPGEISQSVRSAYYAWHAGCWNTWMWGTEHEGFASSPAWYTEAMYQASAPLQRHLMLQNGHPMDRNHVIAHGQKSVAGWSTWLGANYPSISATCNTHTDPGPYWNWSHFMALVIGGTDDASFTSKTVANGASFAPNQAFSCTYTMNNNGTTTWDANGNSGYTLNYVSGTQMGALTINPITSDVGPGSNTTIKVNFIAPATAGAYSVTFQMNSSSGAFFGAQAVLNINVVTPGPTINPQPVSKTVNPGTNVTFTVGATGSGTITYRWRKENVNLNNGGNISGVTTTNLVITNVQQTDVGNYSVAATDANGTTTSASAALAVNTLVAFDETFESGNLNNWGIALSSSTPAATTWDISTAQNHTPGGSKSAYVNISSDRMYRNIGARVAGRGKATFWIYDSTQTREFAEVRSYTGGQFTYDNATLNQLLAAGKYSSVTYPGDIYDGTKYQGRITYTNATATATDVGWFNLNGPGSPSRTAGWHKFEIERLADFSTVKWYVDGILCRTLTGVYSPAWDSVVIGSVGTGTTAGDAWLDDLKVEYYDPPTVASNPLNRTNVAGTTATFTATASGTVNNYRWRKNGSDLSDGLNVSGATSASLTITNVQNADAASYDVVISNGAGPTNSATAKLWVSPKITTQPIGSTNLPATTATFSVVAGGQTQLSYQWRRGTTNLSDGIHISGATSATLTLSSVSPDDEGNYSVVVTNLAGTATSTSASLVVLKAPIILTQPADQSVYRGENATFNVMADGTPPLFYQWRFNSADIIGATNSSYTRFSVSLLDVGDYSVAVNNAADTVVSQDAVLAVITPDIQSVDASAGNFTLTWKALSGKTYRVQYKNNLEDADWTDLLPDVTASGATASKSDSIGNAQRFYQVISVD
ncbi:MAG: N-acetylmuramoyl-L-alanine amidase LytC [Verrucomicrobiales bacterium]|nr:N-acetylmuramoyl-L-alanine amidase LytC [Verrucomicrobiales bacterium]